jgi:AraC-like DNA-binding protein
VLDQQTVIHTSSLDDARVAVSRVLSRHKLRKAAPGAVNAHVSVASISDVSLIYMRHGVALDVEVVEPLDYYDVHLAVTGANQVECAGVAFGVSQECCAVFSPDTTFRMNLSEDYSQLHVRIDRAALERHLEGLLDRVVSSPIRFRTRMDLNASARAATWAGSLKALVEDLEEPTGLAHNSLAAANWANLLMTGLLVTQPSNFTDNLNHPGLVRGSRATKRAVLFIEENAAQPLLASDIARAAGISLRSLQRAFAETVGVSPTEYLRQVRLARVHVELTDADPADGTTVTECAFRWGFTHLPRFAAAYRGRYGSAPSETLRGGS